MNTSATLSRYRLRYIPWEAVFWTLGLLAMACADPDAPGLIDGCLFQWLGVERCPGCGLGHAVAYLTRGEVVASFRAHPLGIPAVAVLTGHIARLVHEAFERKGGCS